MRNIRFGGTRTCGLHVPSTKCTWASAPEGRFRNLRLRPCLVKGHNKRSISLHSAALEHLILNAVKHPRLLFGLQPRPTSELATIRALQGDALEFVCARCVLKRECDGIASNPCMGTKANVHCYERPVSHLLDDVLRAPCEFMAKHGPTHAPGFFFFSYIFLRAVVVSIEGKGQRLGDDVGDLCICRSSESCASYVLGVVGKLRSFFPRLRQRAKGRIWGGPRVTPELPPMRNIRLQGTRTCSLHVPSTK